MYARVAATTTNAVSIRKPLHASATATATSPLSSMMLPSRTTANPNSSNVETAPMVARLWRGPVIKVWTRPGNGTMRKRNTSIQRTSRVT